MLICPIGLRVTTRRIGPPVVGEVRGMLMPLGEMYTDESEVSELWAQWDALYPDWRQHPLVFVAIELSEGEQSGAGETHRLLPYPLADLEPL